MNGGVYVFIGALGRTAEWVVWIGFTALQVEFKLALWLV